MNDIVLNSPINNETINEIITEYHRSLKYDATLDEITNPETVIQYNLENDDVLKKIVIDLLNGQFTERTKSNSITVRKNMLKQALHRYPDCIAFKSSELKPNVSREPMNPEFIISINVNSNDLYNVFSAIFEKIGNSNVNYEIKIPRSFYTHEGKSKIDEIKIYVTASDIKETIGLLESIDEDIKKKCGITNKLQASINSWLGLDKYIDGVLASNILKSCIEVTIDDYVKNYNVVNRTGIELPEVLLDSQRRTEISQIFLANQNVISEIAGIVVDKITNNFGTKLYSIDEKNDLENTNVSTETTINEPPVMETYAPEMGITEQPVIEQIETIEPQLTQESEEQVIQLEQPKIFFEEPMVAEQFESNENRIETIVEEPKKQEEPMEFAIPSFLNEHVEKLRMTEEPQRVVEPVIETTETPIIEEMITEPQPMEENFDAKLDDILPGIETFGTTPELQPEFSQPINEEFNPVDNQIGLGGPANLDEEDRLDSLLRELENEPSQQNTVQEAVEPKVNQFVPDYSYAQRYVEPQIEVQPAEPVVGFGNTQSEQPSVTHPEQQPAMEENKTVYYQEPETNELVDNNEQLRNLDIEDQLLTTAEIRTFNDQFRQNKIIRPEEVAKYGNIVQSIEEFGATVTDAIGNQITLYEFLENSNTLDKIPLNAIVKLADQTEITGEQFIRDYVIPSAKQGQSSIEDIIAKHTKSIELAKKKGLFNFNKLFGK